MKLMHNLPPDSGVCQVRRQFLQERFHLVFHFFLTDVLLKENNYNVCIVFKRRPGITICPTEDMSATLLHPYNSKMNITARVSKERWLSMRRDDCITVENIVTSKKFDEYCIDGKFFICHSSCRSHCHGHERSDCRCVCHCGVLLSRACRHVCREEARSQ